MEDIEKALAPKPKVDLHTALPPRTESSLGSLTRRKPTAFPLIALESTMQ